jgi:hypothetical protein
MSREGVVRKFKKPASRDPSAWEVNRLKSSPAAFVGRVTAKDKTAAIAAAIEMYAVPVGHQKRLLAIRRAAWSAFLNGRTSSLP